MNAPLNPENSEEAPAWPVGSKPLSVAEPAPEPPLADAPLARNSRLSGLRSRFASMGLKGLIKARAAAAEARKASPTVEAPPEPPVPARTYTPFPDDEPRHGAAVLSTSPLTASPDSRPPNDSAENTRRDRRDPFDAVEILPSLRGQYKKK